MDELTLRMLDLHAKGYCCSQIMFIMALELQGKTNPALVRSVAGLCHGIGFSRDVCGVLSGGVCLLSLYTGKGADEEEAHEQYAGIVTDFIYWFQKEIGSANGGIRCSDILSRNDRSMCATLVKTAYEKIMEILAAHGIEPDSTGA
jgi:C_GCAxxG_C_C family probable redox protein